MRTDAGMRAHRFPRRSRAASISRSARASAGFARARSASFVEDRLRAHDLEHLRARAAHVDVQLVARLVDGAVELAVDDELRGARRCRPDRARADRRATDSARRRTIFPVPGVTPCGGLSSTSPYERDVGDDDVVLAVRVHVIDRHVDLLQRAVLLGLIEHDELALVVDVERGSHRFARSSLAVVGVDPESFPARVAGFDVVADRRFEARFDAAGKRARAGSDGACRIGGVFTVGVTSIEVSGRCVGAAAAIKAAADVAISHGAPAVGLDEIAGGGLHAVDAARARRAQRQLHLHRFHDEHLVAFGDLVAGLRLDEHDAARHRRDDAIARSRAALARARTPARA